MMPKKIKKFKVRIKNPKTLVRKIETYLNKIFGPKRDEVKQKRVWNLRCNYNRPRNESFIEIEFFGEPNKKHTLMMFEHPYTIIDEDAEEWYEVNSEIFDNLFEESR